MRAAACQRQWAHSARHIPALLFYGKFEQAELVSLLVGQPHHLRSMTNGEDFEFILNLNVGGGFITGNGQAQCPAFV